MRILAGGDFHLSDQLKDAFVEEANTGDYDLALLIGDFEEPGYYQDLIDALQVPFLSCTGNWDFGFDPPANEEYTHLYNYQQIQFEDYFVVLLGSVYPDDFQEQVHEFFAGTDPAKRIVASHYPPHMLGDLARTGTRAGFPQFRDLILREQPALWVCGHIHEDFGEFALKETTVLNAAAKESGKSWAVEMGDNGVEAAEAVVLLSE